MFQFDIFLYFVEPFVLDLCVMYKKAIFKIHILKHKCFIGYKVENSPILYSKV